MTCVMFQVEAIANATNVENWDISPENVLKVERTNVSNAKKKDTFHATVLKEAEAVVSIAAKMDICPESVLTKGK